MSIADLNSMQCRLLCIKIAVLEKFSYQEKLKQQQLLQQQNTNNEIKPVFCFLFFVVVVNDRMTDVFFVIVVTPVLADESDGRFPFASLQIM